MIHRITYTIAASPFLSDYTRQSLLWQVTTAAKGRYKEIQYRRKRAFSVARDRCRSRAEGHSAE